MFIPIVINTVLGKDEVTGSNPVISSRVLCPFSTFWLEDELNVCDGKIVQINSTKTQKIGK